MCAVFEITHFMAVQTSFGGGIGNSAVVSKLGHAPPERPWLWRVSSSIQSLPEG
jgi:hypothetical protein